MSVDGDLPPTPAPRSELPRALDQVRLSTGIDLQRATVRVGVGRGHLLDLVLKSGEFRVADEASAVAACEQLAVLLLAETYRDWVGAIRTVPGPKASSLRMAHAEPELFHPLQLLPALVDRGIAGIVAGLDERPYHRFCEQAPWTLLELPAPTDRELYGEQDDLLLCSTFLPEMMKCFLQKQPFSSVRFSRHAELFAYVKYESGSASSEGRLTERTLLEDALNRALVPGGVGCVVGGGIGLEFCYVDLALAELNHAVSLCRKVFRQAGVKGPVWLLFCDTARNQGWVALSEVVTTPPKLQADRQWKAGAWC